MGNVISLQDWEFGSVDSFGSVREVFFWRRGKLFTAEVAENGRRVRGEEMIVTHLLCNFVSVTIDSAVSRYSFQGQK